MESVEIIARILRSAGHREGQAVDLAHRILAAIHEDEAPMVAATEITRTEPARNRQVLKATA